LSGFEKTARFARIAVILSPRLACQAPRLRALKPMRLANATNSGAA
jgi:hypothetical protein